MNTLEARRRLLGRNVYKRTTEGNPAIAQGSLARRYPGITMQGWTEQAQYEGKNLLSVDVGQEFDGIVVTDSATFEEDGVHAVFESIVSGEARDIYMYGNSHASVEDSYVEVPILTPGDYRLVNDKIGISLYVVAWRNGASVVLGYADNATTKITIQDGDKFRIFLRCNIIGDTDVKIHPMIVKEGEDTTQYEPYTGGKPSPSPDYPQEIVSAGKYNEDTQKWEYEITIANEQTDPDKNQTVTLTSERPLTKWDRLEKRNGVCGWAYKSGTMTLDGTQFLAVYNNGFYFPKSDNWNTEAKDAYSDKLINKNRKNISGIPHFYESLGNKYYCYVLSVSEIYGSTTGEIKQNLSQNPITFYYETAEETFVPLTESEQEAMNTLYTFRPTTVLSNDCDCNMTLTYKTKKSLEVAT